MLNTNTQINNEKRLDHNFTCFHNHSDNAKTSNICRFRSNSRLGAGLDISEEADIGQICEMRKI